MKKWIPVAVVGGGASGLVAALTTAKQGVQTVVLERLDRVGKKILATGNGRCNLENMHAEAGQYYSRNRKALAGLLESVTPQQVLNFFEEEGLYCAVEEDGKVYPYCYQASMVLDVLRQQLERYGVETLCGFEVSSIRPEQGGFCLEAKDKRKLFARKVILAAGGQASPKLGSNGSGQKLAKALGHHLNPVYPCLVPLKAESEFLPGLKGLRVRCSISLVSGEKQIMEEQGELQFAEYGLSGIPAMQLSCAYGLIDHQLAAAVKIDFFPQMSFQQLEGLLVKRLEQWGDSPMEQLLSGLISKKLGYALLKSAGIAPLSRPIETLKQRELQELLSRLKGWKIPVTGTLSWDQAQVMGGGVRLNEVSAGTMESVMYPGLYLTGELLDVTGSCGGFNLHWAWASGIMAGTSAASSLLQKQVMLESQQKRR